jgi:DNA-binding protein HU-beta
MANSLTKNNLIDTIATNAGLNKSDAANALTAALDGILNGLQNNGKVTLVGFGTFSVSHRTARMGLNPRTKAAIQIPASNTVKFKAGSSLKSAVN